MNWFFLTPLGIFILLYIITQNLKKAFKWFSICFFIGFIVLAYITYQDIQSIHKLTSEKTRWVLVDQQTTYSKLIINPQSENSVKIERIPEEVKYTLFFEKEGVLQEIKKLKITEEKSLNKEQIEEILKRGSEEEKGEIFQLIIKETMNFQDKEKAKSFFKKIEKGTIKIEPPIKIMKVVTALTPSIWEKIPLTKENSTKGL